MSDRKDDDWIDDICDTGIGCAMCGFEGWSHSCCSDLCYACNEPAWCDAGGIPCRHCNPHGEGL